MKGAEILKNFLNKLSRFKIIFIALTIILIGIRLFFEYAKKKKGLLLEYDYMYYVINYIIILSALFICFKNKAIRWIYFGIIIILAIINTVGINKCINNVEFQKKFVRGENMFIIKETKNNPENAVDKTPYSLVYTKSHKIFIRLYDKLRISGNYKPFKNNAYKVTWINDEKAVLKYSYGSKKAAKAKIYNFSKGNGEYQNVLGKLNGTYNDKNEEQSSIQFDNGIITLKINDEKYWYSSSSADEQGNYGTILYDDKYIHGIYILINKDNTITVGSTILKNDKQYIFSR